MSIVDGHVTIQLANEGVYVQRDPAVNGMTIAPYHPRPVQTGSDTRQGWVLEVDYTEHGEIESASVGRWEPDGTPSEKLAQSSGSWPRSSSSGSRPAVSAHISSRTSPDSKGRTMAHPQLTVETVNGSTQATVEGLLQITLLEDGTVEIHLAGKDVEVERKGLQYIVRHETDSSQFPGKEVL